MLYFLLMAVIAALVGVGPYLLRRGAGFIVPLLITTAVYWLILYIAVPSIVWPLFGLIGLLVAITWLISLGRPRADG